MSYNSIQITFVFINEWWLRISTGYLCLHLQYISSKVLSLFSNTLLMMWMQCCWIFEKNSLEGVVINVHLTESQNILSKFRKQFRICLIRMMGQNSNCHTSQFDNPFDIKILFSRSQFVFGLDMYILQLGHNLISWYKLWLLLNYLLCKVNQKLKKHVKNYKKCIFSHS